MKKIFFFFSFFFTYLSIGQVPQVEWSKTLGGSLDDYTLDQESIKATIDGGFILAVVSFSNDGDLNANHGQEDYWIVKINSLGSIEWQKSLGGSGRDTATSIQITSDGYIVAGHSNSTDGDVSENFGGFNAWIVKLDNSGNIEWEKTYLGDYVYSLKTLPNGYIISGIKSLDGINGDYWVFQIDFNGFLVWEKLFDNGDLDYAMSIQNTYDQGFIIAGDSRADEPVGNSGWVIKLDEFGNVLWDKKYGGTGSEYFNFALPTSDEGYIFLGGTNSNDGDVNGNHGDWDSWVVKTNAFGELLWQRCLGGTNRDSGQSLIETSDNGFIIISSTDSNDGDILNNYGGSDLWIVKLDTLGNIMWQKSFGGSLDDFSSFIQKIDDNNFIVSGTTKSNDGDIAGQNHGGGDVVIVKFSTDLSMQEIEKNHVSIYPNPVNNELTINSKRTIREIFIYNLIGQEIRHEKLNLSNCKVDFSDVSLGIYICKLVFTDGQNESFKIIKQ